MADELLALVERCEKASGPDPRLDQDIKWELSEWKNVGGWWREHKTTGARERFTFREPPRYTASLDAAMTLARRQEWCGGAAGLLREAMDRLHAAIQRQLPGTVSHLDPVAYREALARFFTAAGLRARAASVGRNAERQDPAEGLGPKDEHAVPAEQGDAQ